MSHTAEKFRRCILYCCINFGCPKSLDKRGGGYQDIPSKIFRLTVPKISVQKSFTVALLSGIEKVWIRGGGSIKIFRQNFSVSQCRKNPQGNPLLLHQFRVPKKFGEEWGGENQDIPSKNFCFTVPKISVEESFSVALSSGIEKVWISGGRGESRFCIENFLSQFRKSP